MSPDRHLVSRKNEELGSFLGEQLSPPSSKGLSVEALENHYPLRHRLWQIRGEADYVENISPIFAKRLGMLNNLDTYISSQRISGRGRILREKQLAVFVDTRDFLEQGNFEGYVEAPTGFGKTVLFSEIIRATNERTLIVVPSRILVEQTYQRLKQFNPDLDVGRFYGDRKERDKQVTITTYQSMVKSNGGVDPEAVDLLVLDEVHQSLTDVRIRAVGKFNRAIKLGFTATPEYTQDKRVENLLNNEIHAISLKEAVETGLLCSFSVYLAQTDVDLSGVSVTQSGDYDDRELEKAIDIYSRNKSAVELYQKLVRQNEGFSKGLIYCVSVKHARDVAELFTKNGINAGAVWSAQDKGERKRILEAYGRGEVKVLTNVNVLTEGFDDPEAFLCINLRPTLSRVVAKQRGGRILRLDPDNPKKHAIIVDYLDRNEDKRNLQITFAEVAEGAQILNQVSIQGPDLDKAKTTVLREADSQEPEKQFAIEGLSVITNAEEVLRVVRELEEDLYKPPPEGWSVNRVLISELGWDGKVIKKHAEEQRNSHPDWFALFLHPWGHAREYYSPELIAFLRDKLGSLDNAPEGWLNRNDLALKISKSFPYIDRRVESYREEHPEWFRFYRSQRRGSIEFLHPDLVNIIASEVKTLMVAPSSWSTVRSLQLELGIQWDTLKRIIEPQREEHSEWFRSFIVGKTGHVREFLSPELILVVTNKVKNQYVESPEDWITISELSEILGGDLKVLRRRIESIKPGLEGEYGSYRRDQSHLLEFYSPDFVDELKKSFPKLEQAPSGWHLKTAVRKNLKVWWYRLEDSLKEIRSIHPEWFKVYVDTNGVPREYFSDEALDELRKGLVK